MCSTPGTSFLKSSNSCLIWEFISLTFFSSLGSSLNSSGNFDWSLIVCSPVTGSRVPLYWGGKSFTYTGCYTGTDRTNKLAYINGVSPQTVRPYKVIYDNPGLKAHLFYNGTQYLTFNGLSGIATEFQNLHLHCWHNFNVTARPSGCQIAGFKYLSDAQVW